MNYFAHPTAVVEEDVVIGEGTRIWHFAHVRRGARIGSRCVLGKDVYIDENVVVGNGVKIQNGVSIYKGVTLEDNVFVGPYAVFTNDKYPRAFSTDWVIIPTLVKEGASIGANATIICGVTIGRYAMVAAGSVVTRDVPDHGLVMGNPARLVGFVCYCGRSLKRVVKQEERFVEFECDHCGRRIEVDRRYYEEASRNRREIKREY